MTNFHPDRLLMLAGTCRGPCRLLSLVAPVVPAQAEDAPAANQTMSPAPVKGEFDDQCTMGLASGQTVKTDCSVNWTDTDGHVYCFSSDASKEAFLKDPAGNIQKAKDFLRVEADRQGCRREGVHRGGRQQEGRLR